MDSYIRTKLPRRAVHLCIGTTLVVSIVEISIGLSLNLLSITAEGLHTLADLADSLAALVLITMAARPPDSGHPFGHGKFDSLAGLIEGLCVLGSGVWAVIAAGRVLLGFTELDPRPDALALVAMAAASVMYWFVSGYVLRLATRTGSPAVYAEGTHLRSHVYLTAGLLVGVALSWVATSAGWSFARMIDPVVALLLGVLLIGIAIGIVARGYQQVIDSALPPKEREQIAGCLAEFRNEFVEVHAVRTRQAGTDRHVDIHLVLPAETSIQAGHDLAHRIERRVAEVLPGTRLSVHIEPAVGALLSRYDDRGRAGLVVIDEPAPLTQEGDHHTHPGDHQV
ncbi:MAG: cation transporter [Phycisphaerae bacterium]|nr:cation transporter [Phycisphaerae bacterium]